MLNNYIYIKGIVYKNQYHIIFCPKYRRKILIDNIALDLKNILYQIAEYKEVEIKTLEIMPDQVYMFIEIAPRLMLHKVIKDFKGIISRILREKYPSLKSKLHLYGQEATFHVL